MSIKPTSHDPDLQSEQSTARHIEPMAYRLNDLVHVLGVSRRTIERLRTSGQFPEPDRVIGKMSLWSPATIRRWVEKGGE